MFVQSVYQSQSRDPILGHRLFPFQNRAMEFNALNGITSFLFSDQSRIFQVLEGEPANVARAMDRIQASTFHANVKLRRLINVRQRQFEGWVLGTSNDRDPRFRRALGSLYRSDFFKIDTQQAVKILQIVASRKRRSFDFEAFYRKLAAHNSNVRPAGGSKGQKLCP